MLDAYGIDEEWVDTMAGLNPANLLPHTQDIRQEALPDEPSKKKFQQAQSMTMRRTTQTFEEDPEVLQESSDTQDEII